MGTVLTLPRRFPYVRPHCCPERQIKDDEYCGTRFRSSRREARSIGTQPSNLSSLPYEARTWPIGRKRIPRHAEWSNRTTPITRRGPSPGRVEQRQGDLPAHDGALHAGAPFVSGCTKAWSVTTSTSPGSPFSTPMPPRTSTTSPTGSPSAGSKRVKPVTGSGCTRPASFRVRFSRSLSFPLQGADPARRQGDRWQ